VLGAILRDTLAVTGTLFALLVAATTYTLVLRAYGTDAWVAAFLKEIGGGRSALIVALLIFAASAFLLDAFEIIFVIVPIVMPPLLTLVPDAVWVAVLTLVVLQASFLVPPFGYAVLMVGSALRRKLGQKALARSLSPYLFVQVMVVLSVLFWPGLVWHSHPVASGPEHGLTEEQVRELLRQQPLNDDMDASGSSSDKK
jgi:TRAP-type mannitol/chloroaromatic compound transport system permease large subunit